VIHTQLKKDRTATIQQDTCCKITRQCIWWNDGQGQLVRQCCVRHVTCERIGCKTNGEAMVRLYPSKMLMQEWKESADWLQRPCGIGLAYAENADHFVACYSGPRKGGEARGRCQPD
jgi:hypothetical protein